MSVEVERPLRTRHDFQWVLGLTVALCGTGLVLLTSASNVVAIKVHENSLGFSMRQAVSIAIGGLAMYLVMQLNARQLRALSMAAVVSALALLVLVLQIGIEVGGQKNWIRLPLGFTLQPSELAKPAIAMAVGLIFVSAARLGLRRGPMLGLILAVQSGFLLLVFAEKDTGNLLVLAGIMMASLAVVGMRFRHLALLSAVGLLGLVAATLSGPSYRLDRFRAWLDPYAYAAGDGYQLLHGQYALATGGWTGTGLGGSVEKWGSLPAPHTDFILAVIGEEVGLIVTLTILVMLGLLVWFAFQIGIAAADPFHRVVATGIATWLGLQTAINIGGVTGMLPITGVPLPFISYGGSSMVPLLASVGVLLAIARHNQSAERRD